MSANGRGHSVATIEGGVGQAIPHESAHLHVSGEALYDITGLETVLPVCIKTLIEPDTKSVLQFSEEFDGDGGAFFAACAKHQLEGIVSKLAKSPYRSGRSKAWLKTKCFAESELTLLGIDRDHKKRRQARSARQA